MRLCHNCHENLLKPLCKDMHFGTQHQGVCEHCGREEIIIKCTIPRTHYDAFIKEHKLTPQPQKEESVGRQPPSADVLQNGGGIPREAGSDVSVPRPPEQKEDAPIIGGGASPNLSSPVCEATPDERGQEQKKMENENTNTDFGRDDAVDMSTLQGVSFSEGGSKPTFNTITRMKVKSVVLKHGRNDNKKPEKGRDKFDALYIQVVFEAPDKSEFWENYGGIRLYHHEEPKPGEPEVTLWTGKDSYSARLRNLMKDTYGEEVYNDITKMVEKLQVSEVGVITETTKGYSGGEVTKNAIKQVYPAVEHTQVETPPEGV